MLILAGTASADMSRRVGSRPPGLNRRRPRARFQQMLQQLAQCQTSSHPQLIPGPGGGGEERHKLALAGWRAQTLRRRIKRCQALAAFHRFHSGSVCRFPRLNVRPRGLRQRLRQRLHQHLRRDLKPFAIWISLFCQYWRRGPGCVAAKLPLHFQLNVSRRSKCT